MRNEDRRFKVIHKEGNSLGHVMEILVDKETGVHYLFAQSGYAGGLTMLLDSQGRPVIDLTAAYDLDGYSGPADTDVLKGIEEVSGHDELEGHADDLVGKHCKGDGPY